MAIRTIREMGDPILNKKSREVEAMTPRIKDLISDMLDTMYEQRGVGLAAVQVGMLKRMVVIDVGEGPLVLINPVITKQKGEQTGEEGCLSLPGKSGLVTRPAEVTVTALDENMEPITVTGDEFLARAICHECDHLDGVLYVDRVVGELNDVNDDYEYEYEDEDEE